MYVGEQYSFCWPPLQTDTAQWLWASPMWNNLTIYTLKTHCYSSRPLPRRHALQIENPAETRRKKIENGFYSWKQRGNSHIVPCIFLQVPKENNRQATEIGSLLKTLSVRDSSAYLQADRALGRRFFKPQIPLWSRMPLGPPGLTRAAYLKTLLKSLSAPWARLSAVLPGHFPEL